MLAFFTACEDVREEVVGAVNERTKACELFEHLTDLELGQQAPVIGVGQRLD